MLLEAAASGRALVATDAPGCREIIEHGINGYLVPAKDPEALARALRKLAEDTGLRGEMGRQSRKIVELHFSDKLVAEKTVEVYQRLLAGSECE